VLTDNDSECGLWMVLAEEGSNDYFIKSQEGEWLMVDSTATRTDDSSYIMLTNNFKGSSWNFE